jgi:site-specific recombinase XerD
MEAATKIYLREKFDEYLQIKRRSSSTRGSIQKSVAQFMQWIESENIPLLQVSYNDVLGYVNYCKQRGNKARTQQIMLTNLSQYFSFLQSESEVAENPCSNVKIHGIKRKQLYETFSAEELDAIYKQYGTEIQNQMQNQSQNKNVVVSYLSVKRNKAILSLLIYQGLRSAEVVSLKVSDVNLQAGKIEVAGKKGSEGRALKLESHQVYELMDYLHQTRKSILLLTGKATDQLFTSLGSSEAMGNVLYSLCTELKNQNGRIRDLKQLRASVITDWLKQYSIRKVQYLAGHRYVSSTEMYQANNMDALKEEVNKYHPNL